ncbi:MAG: rhodanese-like domain-containing protein [Vicinamibacterales bacterium]
MRQQLLAVAALFVLLAGAGSGEPIQEAAIKDGPDRQVQADEIDEYIQQKKVFFLDVREPKELEELGTLEGYYNIPIGELEKRLGEVPKDRLILTA